MDGKPIATSQTFKDYVTSVNVKSEQLIKTEIPRIIQELNGILDSKLFDLDYQKNLVKEAVNVHPIHPSPNIPTNSVIVQHLNVVKPFIRSLREHTDILGTWLKLLIPKIEDGNNFGVEIQEDTLVEVKVAGLTAEAFYDSISTYYGSRGQLLSKTQKHTHIDDYKKVIAELDEMQLFKLRVVLTKVRNIYASIYDLIGKNWEKIVNPRTSNTSSMY